MICVFDVIEGPARGKRFWLRENQSIAVGRLSTADFSVPSDSHMSRHHLIFEALVSVIRVRDVGSANGTYVNNSRVNNLELCPGDKVKAGVTTFEVSILEADADPHQGDRIVLDGTLGATADTLPRAAPKRVLQYSQADEALQTLANPDEMRSVTDDLVTMQCAPLWWSALFEPAAAPYVFTQRPVTDKPQADLAEVMQMIRPLYAMALVVNVAQLSPQAAQLLSGSLDAKLVSRLSRSLSLVRCDGSDSFWEFVRGALRQDALVCLAAAKPFEAAWIDELLDCLSYPSMLSGLLDASVADPGLQRRLLQHVQFALFEKSRNGQLCLLLGNDAGLGTL